MDLWGLNEIELTLQEPPSPLYTLISRLTWASVVFPMTDPSWFEYLWTGPTHKGEARSRPGQATLLRESPSTLEYGMVRCERESEDKWVLGTLMDT